MKKISYLIAACMLCIMASTAHAQTLSDFKKMPATQKAKLITDSLKNTLGLTAAQYTKVYTGVLEGVQKAAPIMQGNAARGEKRQQVMAILATEEDHLRLILSPEQFAAYQLKKQNAITYYMHHLYDQKIIFNVPTK